MSPIEVQWYTDQRTHGWVMPCAPWWKRLPVIRQIRGFIAYYKVNRHAAFWGAHGIGFGRPAQSDLWICYGIWTGKERPMGAL